MRILRGPTRFAIPGGVLAQGSWLAAPWLLLLAGCGSKDAVSLSARIESPELGVEQAALGGALSGRFRLVLKLGDLAPGSTEVSLGGVSLVRGAEELRSPLQVAPASPFPLALAAGASLGIDFAIEDQQLLTPDESEAVCSAPVELVVVVTDTLSDAKTATTRSNSFEPGCD